MLHRLAHDAVPCLHQKVVRWSPLLVGGDSHLQHRTGCLLPPISLKQVHFLPILAGHGQQGLTEYQGPSKAVCHHLEPSVFITPGNRWLPFHPCIRGPQGQQRERLRTPLYCRMLGHLQKIAHGVQLCKHESSGACPLSLGTSCPRHCHWRDNILVPSFLLCLLILLLHFVILLKSLAVMGVSCAPSWGDRLPLLYSARCWHQRLLYVHMHVYRSMSARCSGSESLSAGLTIMRPGSCPSGLPRLIPCSAHPLAFWRRGGLLGDL